MGYAQGELMLDVAPLFFDAVWTYIEVQVEEAINGSVTFLKPWFVDLVSELTCVARRSIQHRNQFIHAESRVHWIGNLPRLDRSTASTFLTRSRALLMQPDTLCDAHPEPHRNLVVHIIQANKIAQIHMLGELTKGGCSMYGAWGEAVAQTNSQLMQLRALDWDVDGPFKDFPQITVYHPTPGTNNGHPFANIGWTGWIGSITGISSVQMAISEIGVYFPDSTFGAESRHGIPFTYILRDILQFDETLADSQQRLSTANRTCDLIFGVGDAKSNQFNSVEYSASVCNFYDDTDMEPYNATWHPRMTNVVYYGMDWLCPGYDEALYNQLTKYYGNITAENTIQDITAIVQTGNLHIAVYDLTNMILYVANAARDGVSGPKMAYDRTFTRLDMNQVHSHQLVLCK